MIRRRLRRVELTRYWLPALAWSIFLVSMSGGAGSGSTSGSALESFIAATFGPVSPDTFEVLHFTIRKSMHLLAYGLAGLLNFRAIRQERSGWTPRWSLIAIALVVAVASIDEIRQSAEPGRTGSAGDVFFDFAGATFAQFIVRANARKHRADHPSTASPR